MKLLLDQDVYAVTALFLSEQGHDLVKAAQLGLSQAPDETLLRTAHAEGRLFVTRDRDFGNLTFVKGLPAGVLYLRMMPTTMNSVHQELAKVLETYTQPDCTSTPVHKFATPRIPLFANPEL
ncbi:MAG: hypothetical protein GY865_01100 [candidate division Zixibacteria bacterium]|nr:hypothetical protein [candidate division Zixibacteria bacterium]